MKETFTPSFLIGAGSDIGYGGNDIRQVSDCEPLFSFHPKTSAFVTFALSRQDEPMVWLSATSLSSMRDDYS